MIVQYKDSMPSGGYSNKRDQSPVAILAKNIRYADELNYWKNRQTYEGDPIIPEKDLFFDTRTFMMVDNIKDGTLFISPQNYPISSIHIMAETASKLDGLLGIQAEQKKSIRVLIYPGTIIGKGYADGETGEHMIIKDDESIESFCHEYVHCRLMQRYGLAKSAVLREGAAEYFTFLITGLSPKSKDTGTFGVAEIAELSRKKLPVGFSIDYMRRQLGWKPLENKISLNEHSYRIGFYLADYFIKQFGLQKYLELYQLLCRKNLYDRQSGTPLIVNGVVMIDETDLILSGLRMVNLDSEKVFHGFDTYIKEQTLSNEKLVNYTKLPLRSTTRPLV